MAETKNVENLEFLIKNLEETREGFYREIIPIHESVELREFAKSKRHTGRCGFSTQKKGNYGLLYNEKGFALSVSCYDGDYLYPFLSREGKLLATSYNNLELLDFFPKLNVETVIISLESEFKKTLENSLSEEQIKKYGGK